MKILVCGGRDYSNREHMNRVLYQLYPVRIIHGGAEGADKLAGLWAAGHSIPVDVFPARWDLYGKQAGILRNAEMLEKSRPDIVLAFPGGRGTEDMVRRSKAAGYIVLRVA